jgi:DNA-binding IclR family transcriptional regulator
MTLWVNTSGQDAAATAGIRSFDAHGFAAGDRAAPLPRFEPSLRRTMAVLALFTAETPTATPHQVLDAVGGGEMEVQAILDSLRVSGLLEWHGELGAYGVGLRAVDLATAYQSQTALIGLATPILRYIGATLDETVMLAVRSGDFRVNIAQVPGTQFFSQPVSCGQRKALYIGAGGKILLAGMSTPTRENYLDRMLQAASPEARARITELLARIRETGFAESFSEGCSGGASFAAAVIDAHQRTIATLAVSVPLHRYSQTLRDFVRQLLLNGADELQQAHHELGLEQGRAGADLPGFVAALSLQRHARAATLS